ncbi:hypothetical protein LTR10_010353 [Elasticomyces elasticus]|nr:hypothetical protein LTR10_010353 [Elasticomyces elasticus]KAK4972256.1 hypothetical protein LTR42_006762 [Elasticomyces elasticus]
MQPTNMLSLLALSTLASALPSHSGLYRRSGCHYAPDMMNGESYTTTPLFLLRIEEVSSNNTIGYVDAFSSDYAIISGRNSSAQGFVAPYYNGYGSLIFWAGDNGTDRAFHADDTQLANVTSTLPVTTRISSLPDGVASCGTKPVYMHSKYTETGSCVFGGEDVDIHFRCPAPGTVNSTPASCWAQSYYSMAITSNSRPAWLDQDKLKPLSSKRKVSLTGFVMEDLNKRRRHEDDSNDDDPDRASTTRNTGSAAAQFFDGSKPKAKAKSTKHEVFKNFERKRKEIPFIDAYLQATAHVNAYQQGARASMDERLEPILEELDARLNGFDKQGRPLARPGIPTKADWHKLEEDMRACQTPIGEEEMHVEVPQKDGSMATKRITLDSVFDKYKKLCARKDAEMQPLEQEFARVDAEITIARTKLDDESDIVSARERYNDDMKKFKEASKAAKDRLAREFEQAKAEDKASTAQTNKKIEEFMKGLQ